MKKAGYFLWWGWLAVSVLISPVWLFWTILNLTGLIYRYDVSMDEGTAFLFGIVMLMIWCALVLLPGIKLLKYRKKTRR